MPIKLFAIILFLFFMPSSLRADGCKFRADGHLVPEREQRAMIEWVDGIETLHVAARSDPTAEGSIWIVPIRANPRRITAEPVEVFPMVVYYDTLTGRAQSTLRAAITAAAMFDSFGLCCPLVGVGCGAGKLPSDDREVARIEKLGMIVTVVKAETQRDLEEYLEGQGVNRSAADLSSLEPYFGRSEMAFVCGWVAKRGEPVTATGMRIAFPSPTIWFPLRPTRAYREPVETVVYVRGFMKPVEGFQLPGLKCEYVYGVIENKGLQKTFAHAETPEYKYSYFFGKELLTRVTLTTDPQQWDRDLELVPGTTFVGTICLAINGWLGNLFPVISAVIGACLGLFIPWLTIKKAERCRRDWLMGSLVGAAIVATILASSVIYSIWWWLRFPEKPRPSRRFVVLPILATLHFGIVLALCRGLMEWISWAS